ncbi:hypothetical protein [Streptomyces sp. NPDC094468]|jgi:hypothetical protein|uniref:hypothetical protein n=1 Tax=Streptomyces sp. NPDC094468 TaxID=3366066 RepID=UPI00382A2508
MTIEEVQDFIGTLTDPAAVAQIQEAAAQQCKSIDRAAFAQIASGRRARINTSLRSTTLRGLTGTVQERSRSGTRAAFLLDEASTKRLRTNPRNVHYRIPANVRRFRVPGSGIPLACLELIDG